MRLQLFLLSTCLWLPLPAAAASLSVFVSVPPLQTVVERVGGDWVRAHSMVLPGQSPHSYEPTARQVTALAAADLYVTIGVPFEDAWMVRLRAANPRMRVLDAREGLDLRPLDPDHRHDHDHDHDHRHGQAHGHGHGDDTKAPDSHVWTSPPLVRIIAARIRDTLTELAPEHAAAFAANQAAFDEELRVLDAWIEERLAPLEQRRFLVDHPAWGYFADRYGLTQLAIEQNGKEPGARALTALIEQARREGVRVIFVQPQFSPRSAEQVARAIGGRVTSVDPLSPDYVGTLRQFTDLLAGHE